jgi:hypothetical protein
MFLLYRELLDRIYVEDVASLFPPMLLVVLTVQYCTTTYTCCISESADYFVHWHRCLCHIIEGIMHRLKESEMLLLMMSNQSLNNMLSLLLKDVGAW